MPIEQTPICLSFKEVIMCAFNEVLMEVYSYISLIFGDPQGILDYYPLMT